MATSSMHPVSEAAAGRWPAAAVDAARDALFEDADQHGPRARELTLRAATAVLVLPAAALVALELARGGAPYGYSVTVALAAMLAAGYWLAPLSRLPVAPLLGLAVVCLGPAAYAIAQGALVVAAPVATLGSLLLGLSAARVVYRAVWVAPMLFVAGISDVQSVQGGLTQRLLDGAAGDGARAREVVTTIAPAAVRPLDYLVVHVPIPGGIWILGLVDIVAIGLLLALAHLYWQPLLRTAGALAVAVAISVGLSSAVPVLPALGLAWIVAHWSLVWRSTRFTLRRMMYLGG